MTSPNAVVTLRGKDLENTNLLPDPWRVFSQKFEEQVRAMHPGATAFHLTSIFALPDATGLRLVGYFR